MKKQLKEINVGNLLKEIDEAEEENIIAKSTESSSRTKAEYEVAFKDSYDFAIHKKNKRTDKLLISIYSKNLLYFYDNLNGNMEKITRVEQLNGFFNDVKANEIVIPKEASGYLEKDVLKSNIEEWYRFATAGIGLRMFVLSGLITFDYRTDYLEKEMNEFYEKDKSLLRYIIANSEEAYSVRKLEDVLTFTYEILEISDLSTAKYYFDKRKMSTNDLYHSKKLTEFKKFNLNTRRFIDYILFDLYKQGATGSVLTTYYDYLSMSEDYYGTVKEKYPKALLTEHMILSAKINEKASISKNSEQFETVMNECENFGYSTLTDKFVIVMPKESIELVEEGQTLCHCVASYVDKVVANDCIVVFMRLKEDKETPYLTIEILPDRSVPQVEGMNKRSELTQEEIDFIKKWAKARSLKVTADNVINRK